MMAADDYTDLADLSEFCTYICFDGAAVRNDP